MNFASFPYLLFLAVSVFFYYYLKKQNRALFLLFASYFFYSLFGLGFAALMLITTIITYSTSYNSYYSASNKMRKAFFLLGLSLDLLIFILFKYLHIIDIDFMNWPNWSAQKLLIPIGISFYTFKTIGYCIDVYRRRYPPESSFLYYSLSVSFFPQLIAGPIEKSITISSQIRESTSFEVQICIDGGKLILWGLFKKIVIADGIAQIINPVFSNLEKYHSIDYWIALAAFAYQMYTDFSGYSDIAIGSAKCFGVDLPANFNKPFFSKNFFSFWSRWHISFSKWLKEYIFDYVLNGKKKQSTLMLLLKIWIIFLLVGLWHGATLNFLLYAQLAFILAVIGYSTKSYIKHSNTSVYIKTFNYISIMIMLSLLGVFFRLQHNSDSLYVLQHLFELGFPKLKKIALLFLIGYIILFEFMQSLQITDKGHCFEKPSSFYVRLAISLFMTFSILLLHSKPTVAFQYFQF